MADYSNYTQSVIAAIGTNASPRVKETFPILIKHLHAAIIEADMTIEEWLQACNILVEAGKISNEKRNEVVLMSDVLGVESLCDMLDHERGSKQVEASNQAATTTPSAILGPFYREGVPAQENGTSIIRTTEKGAPFTFLHGTVTGENGKPLVGAIVDVWEDAPDGLYDAQSPQKPDYHCRGRFITDSEGRYNLICVKPSPYPIPFDGPAGTLLTLMDRHPMRPSHIHFYVAAKGYRSLITQVFDRESKYLEDDSVFAVKESLICDFGPVVSPLPKGGEFDEAIQFELKYDIVLSSL